MTVIEFKPNSRISGNPAAQRNCASPNRAYTPNCRNSPEAAPDASGRLAEALIAAGVFVALGLFIWWAV